MTSTIAVLFVHGVEIKDPHYADNAIKLLHAEYARACRGAEAAQLEIEAAFWIPVVEPGLDKIVRASFGRGFAGWSKRLDGLVHRINNNSYLAMVPLVASGVLSRVPGLPKAHWPTLRWAVTYFLGDVIAYQIAEGSDANYDAIHARLDKALAALAERAPDAPLCVIAHNLGTVIASDYFYDLQKAGSKKSKKSARESSTALQRGETLTWLYTLGSPIALWMVRHPKFDAPIKLPGRTRSAAARKAAQWLNFHDPDDIVAYPLERLEPRRRVTDDAQRTDRRRLRPIDTQEEEAGTFIRAVLFSHERGVVSGEGFVEHILLDMPSDVGELTAAR